MVPAQSSRWRDGRGIGISHWTRCPNNAAAAFHMPFERYSAKRVAVALEVNLRAIHHALPHLVETSGAIVTIASTAGLRANCIGPGFVATPMNAGVHDDPDAVARIAKGIPLGRIATAGEIASVACHFLSDDASYVNGQVLAVDGGATVV